MSVIGDLTTDLCLVFESLIECDEAVIEQQLDILCDRLNGPIGILDKVCRGLVDAIMSGEVTCPEASAFTA